MKFNAKYLLRGLGACGAIGLYLFGIYQLSKSDPENKKTSEKIDQLRKEAEEELQRQRDSIVFKTS